MKVYVFKDTLDLNTALIIATSEQAAISKMNENTTLDFDLVDTRPVPEQYAAFLINNILPF